MKLRVGIVLTVLLISSLIAICYAYQISSNGTYSNFQSKLFWVLCDLERCSLLAILIYLLRVFKPAQFFAVLYLCFALNSLNTSLFGNINRFGVEQKIFGWMLSVAIVVGYIVYTYVKFRIHKKLFKANEECKRDSRDKYVKILTKFEDMDNKIDLMTKEFENVFTRRTK
jgi:hypothetical protein